MSVTAVLMELKLAEMEDRAAKSAAMQLGLLATQPLNGVRLQQLCALGEKMMHTGRRRDRAIARACELFA